MTVGATAEHIEVLEGFECSHGETAAQEDADAVNDLGRQVGDVGDGAFLDFAIFAVRFADENSGGGETCDWEPSRYA